ncbi:MAG: outer membrane lipoprotein-sorting protein [Limnochordia bacterium]|jgi:outer membrane lipoprotein-sorting protein
MKKALLSSLIVACLLVTVTAQAAIKQSDVERILRNVDNASTFMSTDFSAEMTMISQDPEKGVEKHVVRIFRRDRDDKFLLLFQEPKVLKGQGYLRVDDSLWFYDPESRKFSHTSMKQNFGSTDAKNSDFAQRTLSDDYKATSWTEGTLGAHSVYIIELEAVNDEVTYPYLKLWIGKNPNLILKAEEYSLSKRLLRTSLFPSYVQAGKSYVPNSMIIVDELVKGRKTQISMKGISLDRLPDSVFTKSYVERVNR